MIQGAPDRVNFGSSRFGDSGDVVGLFTVGGRQELGSTSSNSYNTQVLASRFRWDRVFPANATIRVSLGGFFNNNCDQINVRIQNFGDGETVIEGTDLGSGGGSNDVVSETFSPTTTSSVIAISLQIRNGDGATSVTVDDQREAIGDFVPVCAAKYAPCDLTHAIDLPILC